MGQSPFVSAAPYSPNTGTVLKKNFNVSKGFLNLPGNEFCRSSRTQPMRLQALHRRCAKVVTYATTCSAFYLTCITNSMLAGMNCTIRPSSPPEDRDSPRVAQPCDHLVLANHCPCRDRGHATIFALQTVSAFWNQPAATVSTLQTMPACRDRSHAAVLPCKPCPPRGTSDHVPSNPCKPCPPSGIVTETPSRPFNLVGIIPLHTISGFVPWGCSRRQAGEGSHFHRDSDSRRRMRDPSIPAEGCIIQRRGL